MNEEVHEQEIRQLERELRSYGDPYASPEPDERYFANFRARVMERISSEQPQPVGLMQRASEFFFGSTLRMAISGGSLVAATLVYFTLQSSPEQPVAHQAQPEQPIAAPQATQQDPLAQQPAVTAPMQTEVIAPKVAAVKEQLQVATPAPVQDKISETNPTQNIAEASAAFDDIDELSMSDESDPVSYDKLSMEELEAVLKTLETEPLTIQ